MQCPPLFSKLAVFLCLGSGVLLCHLDYSAENNPAIENLTQLLLVVCYAVQSSLRLSKRE